jgi:hypothetical protein
MEEFKNLDLNDLDLYLKKDCNGEQDPDGPHDSGCVKDLYCSDCDGICPMNHNPELREKFDKLEY